MQNENKNTLIIVLISLALLMVVTIKKYLCCYNNKPMAKTVGEPPKEVLKPEINAW